MLLSTRPARAANQRRDLKKTRTAAFFLFVKTA